jgi:hypothetical protein
MELQQPPRDVTPEELAEAVALIRRGPARRSRPKVRLQTAAEVLKAAELRVITRAEARALLGLRKRAGAR